MITSFMGMRVYANKYLVDTVHRPPKNRRETRRRVIVARRRKRMGRPMPKYTMTVPSRKVIIANDTIFAHPHTLLQLQASVPPGRQ